VGSLAALLFAAAVRVPLGTAVTVTIDGGSGPPVAGQIVGDFMVAAQPRRGSDGRLVVELRPLALGSLAVPLAGGPRPAVVEVVASTAADAALAPPRAPVLPLPRSWFAAGGLVATAVVGVGMARRRRRRAPRDPAATLRRALAPLASPAGWMQPDGSDRVSHAVRAYLAATLMRPCVAMTTREVAGELVVCLGPVRATPFVAALELADAARFAGAAVAPETGATCVAVLLDATSDAARGAAA